MKPPYPLLLLTIALLTSPTTALHTVSVVSTSPWTCDAVSGVDIAFTADQTSIRASFPTIELVPSVPAHGYPGGDSSVGCGATVEFVDFAPQRRFAVADVTWTAARLVLEGDNDFYSLAATVNFTVERLTNYSPVRYPLVKDSSSSLLVDLDVDPGIGNDSYDGEFKFTAENPNLEWSTCFGGYLANATKIGFDLSARTRKGGTSSPGWSMDLGLVWEECYSPDDVGWGQKVIPGWESCTYRRENQTSSVAVRY